jgi:putative spermidine/putrescine transport system permease protein
VVAAHLVPTIPYVTAVLTAGFVRHDRRLEAQAAVLGASDRQRLRLVTLPAMRGALVVAGALGFSISWSQYLLTVLVGSGRVITITMLLFAALSGGNPSTIGVLALVAAAPAAVLLVAAGTHADRRAAT